ncbi:IPTL-CTERM sorting domain-containing protein [Ottowia sp.]|uniref:IPTL-CTERM sorting domain-containing protein n=1 Tax=Ottowia sp. TaxID=1898956 RepID=UPI002BF23D96|nr:IPTL-CTERM sorting domain-containing protein [Ottowia sp.]HOB66090.1 IPTL-CTERM sorting domain-containing protein [Ottowia sp.]HPZ57802.1 IPTL-CTERM sorting domain-containing protein [Ottowia sp.]HQD48033.1 IPTL-CTERM sorting domain-containing protein [Ottowia sp.]
MRKAVLRVWFKGGVLAGVALGFPLLAQAASVDLTVNDVVATAAYHYTDTAALHTVTIGNRGPEAATNAVLTFNNPKSAGTAVAWNTQVTCTPSGGAVCPASYALDSTKAILTATVPSVPMGGQLVFSIPAPIQTDLNCACVLALVEKASSTATVTASAADTELAPATNVSNAAYAVNNPRIDYGLSISDPVVAPIAGTPDSLYTYTVTLRNNSVVAEPLSVYLNAQYAQGTATAAPGNQYFASPQSTGTSNPTVTCVSGAGGASCAGLTVSSDNVSYAGMPPGSSVTFKVSLVVGAPACTDPTKGGKAGDNRQVSLSGSVSPFANVVSNGVTTRVNGLYENTGTDADNAASQTSNVPAALCDSGDLLVQSIVNSGTQTYGPNAPFSLTASYGNGAGSPNGATNASLVFHVAWPAAGLSLNAAPGSCTPSGGALCPTSWVLSADKTTLTGVAPLMPPNSTLQVNFTGTTGQGTQSVCGPLYLTAQADIVPPVTYADTNYDPTANPPYTTGTQTKGNNAYQLQPQANVGVSCVPNFDLEVQKSGPYQDAAATVGLATAKPGDWIYFKSVVTLLPGSAPLTQYTISDQLNYWSNPQYTSTSQLFPFWVGNVPAYQIPSATVKGVMMIGKPGDPPGLPTFMKSSTDTSGDSGVRCVASNGATCPDTVRGSTFGYPSNSGFPSWSLGPENWTNGQPVWPAGGALTLIYAYRMPPLTGAVSCVTSDKLSYPRNIMSVGGTPTPIGTESNTANNRVTVPFDMLNLPLCEAAVSLTKKANVTAMPANGKVVYTLVMTNTSAVDVDVPRLREIFQDAGIDQGVTATIACGAPTGGALCPSFTPLQGMRYTNNGATSVPTTGAENILSQQRPDFDFSWGTPGSKTLPAGGSVTFTVTVQYPGTQTSATNAAFASPDASAQAQFATVRAATYLSSGTSPILLVNKDVSPKQPAPGSTVTYTVDLLNANSVAATGLSFTDAMDASLQATNPAGYGNLSCRPLTAADGQLVAPLGAATCPAFTSNASGITGTLDLPGNSGLRLTYTAIASPTGAVSVPNTAALRSSATARGTGDGSSQANFDVLPPLPDMTSKISPIANADNMVPGASVTASVTFNNIGTAAGLNVVPTLKLAPGMTGITVSNGGVYDPATGLVTWPTIGSFAPNAPVTYTVSFSMPGGALTLASNITATNEPSQMLANNTDSLPLRAPVPAPVPTLEAGAMTLLTLLMLAAAARRRRQH